MSVITHVAVVVPAADEQDTIIECLTAIASARELLARERPSVTSDIIVVLDGCRDNTVHLVARMDGVHVLTSDDRCVGRARDLGTRAALERSPVRNERVWTAHTDADSVVPAHWLLAGVKHAENGATVLLGTVSPNLSEPALSQWRVRHSDQDGHHHVHGANFGIRGDAVLRLGGWRPLTSGEDVDLAGRAAEAGEPIARPAAMAVRTSARRVGRAPRGFSSYLRGLDRAIRADSAEPLSSRPGEPAAM